jgi:riboflavin kinase/FMN adenylyltransferase
MKLIENLELISEPFLNAVITIGNFDGVHNGHRALLDNTIKKAKDIDGTSVAIT